MAFSAGASGQHEQSVEQLFFGTKSPPVLLESFDGLGEGFEGPQGTARHRNPSDNSLAVGHNHIVQTVNSRMAIFTKKGELYDTTGEVLLGPIKTNHVFEGFGGPCEQYNNGDAVVRYDQLADRWLVVMPIFRRLPPWRGSQDTSWCMCYAVSATPDPTGEYYRYEFARPLFPDYPRPAVWPDGYYVPTSTGDHVIQKHVCVADRNRMLKGEEATEQCFIIDGAGFLNTSDLDGMQLPPEEAPNIVMATGGAQLKGITEDDGIYYWTFHVDWDDTAKSRLDGPEKIPVAPYEYLGGGQLTREIPQAGTDRGLDSQGDKLMARTVYRRIGDRQSIVAVHSVSTSSGGGGVRWYEFRISDDGELFLFQQGTYAPDTNYRWMASPAMDADGNIGIGYSFSGKGHFPGQRFAGRMADDEPGILSMDEAVLIEGEAAQVNTYRWEDYSQTAIDPSDDRTIWYVGDYLKEGATSYSTRVGAFRISGGDE